MSNTVAAQAIWSFAEHEHRALVRGLNEIHDLACGIGTWLRPTDSVRLLGILEWLERELEPHVAWEEAWLYPTLDARTGTPWTTRAARFDHTQIRTMAAQLRNDQHLLHQEVTPEALAELRCHLFGLEALLRAHLEREERFLMPLLTEAEPSDSREAAVTR
jgi:iron-sulfur cluster repair protein YtfE (RIC family)